MTRQLLTLTACAVLVIHWHGARSRAYTQAGTQRGQGQAAASAAGPDDLIVVRALLRLSQWMDLQGFDIQHCG